ncbi:MAG TPA: oxidoreductase [Pseudonocardiaceae bacterium]
MAKPGERILNLTPRTAAERRLENLLTRSNANPPRRGSLQVTRVPVSRQHQVRAEFLVDRLINALDGGSQSPLVFWRRRGRPPVVWLTDAYITGRIDLQATELPFVLEFDHCRFEEAPDLRQATIAGLKLEQCWLPGLQGKNLTCRNDMVLHHTVVQGGTVDLVDADVESSLELKDAVLVNPGGWALRADRLRVSGAFIATHLRCYGELRMPGARIGGNLNLSGARLRNRGGDAFSANGLVVGGNLMANPLRGCPHPDVLAGRPTTKEVQRFHAVGRLLLPNARISSDLTLRGATLHHALSENDTSGDGPAKFGAQNHSTGTTPPSTLDDRRAALVADRIRVDGNVEIDDGFTCTATIRMLNGVIGGTLRLAKARLCIHQPLTRAIHLDGTQINGDLDAQHSTVVGQLRMLDVQVKGSAVFSDARLHHPGSEVLLAHRLSVGGNLEGRRLRARGTLLLQSAHIGGSVNLFGAWLCTPGQHTIRRTPKPSLDLLAARIGRDLLCNGMAEADVTFRAEGGVRVRRAVVAREASFRDARLEGVSAIALNAYGLTTQELVLSVGAVPGGRVILRHARCTSLEDNETFWSGPGEYDVEDFRYESFAHEEPPYRKQTQPDPGTPSTTDPRGSLDIPRGLARARLRDRTGVRRRLRWLAHAMGGDYQPGPYDQLAATYRAAGDEESATEVLMEKQKLRYEALAADNRAWPVRVLIIVWSWLQRSMVGYGYRPMRALAWLVACAVLGSAWFSQHELVPVNEEDHPVWDPVLYAVDQLIPIVNLGHDTMWRADGASKWITVVLIAIGWVLATTVAAGITRTLRRTS